jgi:membrane protease YdiL (CAAX protease family)
VTPLDYVMLAALLIGVPASALWRSFRPPAGPRSLSHRLIRTIVKALVLTVLLASTWSANGRAWSLLGLEWPISRTGLVGLAAAGAFLLIFFIMLAMAKVGPPPAREVDMIPKTRGELALFLLTSLVIGLGWELLYRGYLVWALEPRLGTVASVACASLAYGLAHGGKTLREWSGPVLMAILFTIGFVATRSLWWLMLSHVGLGLIGLMAGRIGQRART